MKNIKIFRLIFLVTIAFSIWNCEDQNGNYIDYAKLEAEERALLEQFYESKLDSLLSLAVVLDSVKVEGSNSKVAVIDTLDQRETTGLLMIRTFKSSPQTDTIKSGHEVAFRFTLWGIYKDKNGESAIGDIISNRGSNEPISYIVGNYSNSYYVSYGIDEAIRNMQFGDKGDKCTLILPSPIGAQTFVNTGVMEQALTYTTIIADIEVTHWSDR